MVTSETYQAHWMSPASVVAFLWPKMNNKLSIFFWRCFFFLTPVERAVFGGSPGWAACHVSGINLWFPSQLLTPSPPLKCSLCNFLVNIQWPLVPSAPICVCKICATAAHRFGFCTFLHMREKGANGGLNGMATVAQTSGFFLLWWNLNHSSVWPESFEMPPSYVLSFCHIYARTHTHTHTQAVRTHRHGHTDLFTGTWPRHHHLHTHTHTLVETGLVLNYCLPWKKRRTEKKGASLEQQQKKAGAVKGHSAPGQIDVLAGKHIPAGWLWQACQKAH